MELKNLVNHLSQFISEERNQKFDKILSLRTKHFTVAVEDVYQLHNTSAVIRSCDVFGIQDIHIIEERNTKKIDREIAMGSQKWVDIHRHTTAVDCLDKIKSKGYKIVATSPHSKDMSLSDLKIEEPCCFFFGSEAEGLSDTILKNADYLLKIPMFGFTESLNISVSAAIILHHASTGLRKSSIDWKLAEEEKLEIKLQWIKRTLKSHKAIIERYKQST